MKSAVPCLLSERLYLSEITEDDTDTIVRWRSDPTIFRYFLNPHQITVKEHLEWYQTKYVFDETRYDFIAKLLSTNEPIGIFGVKKINHDTIEISYLLDQSKQSCGYAKEAMQAVISFAKNHWDIQQMIAEIHRENSKSIRFAESLGLTLAQQNEPFLIFSKKI